MRASHDPVCDVWDVYDADERRIATYEKIAFALHHLNAGHPYSADPPCCEQVDRHTGLVRLPMR